MTTTELKQFIRNNYTGIFGNLIQGYYHDSGFLRDTKLSFDWVEEFRGDDGDHDTYTFVFSIDGKNYAVEGWYSSNDGCNLDDPWAFYPVKKRTKTVEVWEAIDDEG